MRRRKCFAVDDVVESWRSPRLHHFCLSRSVRAPSRFGATLCTNIKPTCRYDTAAIGCPRAMHYKLTTASVGMSTQAQASVSLSPGPLLRCCFSRRGVEPLGDLLSKLAVRGRGISFRFIHALHEGFHLTIATIQRKRPPAILAGTLQATKSAHFAGMNRHCQASKPGCTDLEILLY